VRGSRQPFWPRSSHHDSGLEAAQPGPGVPMPIRAAFGDGFNRCSVGTIRRPAPARPLGRVRHGFAGCLAHPPVGPSTSWPGKGGAGDHQLACW